MASLRGRDKGWSEAPAEQRVSQSSISKYIRSSAVFLKMYIVLWHLRLNKYLIYTAIYNTTLAINNGQIFLLFELIYIIIFLDKIYDLNLAPDFVQKRQQRYLVAPFSPKTNKSLEVKQIKIPISLDALFISYCLASFCVAVPLSFL